MSAYSESIVKSFTEGDNIRDAGLTTPENVDRYDDLQYGEDRKWQLLDVYRPKEGTVLLPVIISVHGGGWVYGDKERYQYYCMSLAQRGFAVINFTYRLAPAHKFPASLEDTNLVAHWIMKNAEMYGLDTTHIYAVGDSAGAHILGLYAAILTNLSYAAKYDFKPPVDFMLKAVALNCGLYHVAKNDAEDRQTMRLMQEFLPEKGTDAELSLIHVEEHMTKEYPPVFLMTATGDFLKKQAPEMESRLLELDIPHEFRYFSQQQATEIRRGENKGKERPLGHVFHVNMRLREAATCNDEECDFFRRFS